MEALPAPNQTQRRNWETLTNPTAPRTLSYPTAQHRREFNSRLLETQESRKLASKVLKGRGRNV